MKVLLSAPRAGSSYCYEQIKEENLKLPNVQPTGPKSEFFNPIISPEKTLEEKIAWLNEEKAKGNNYTFKHHINYLKFGEHDYYNNWFIDFYKDDEIIVLKRKDIWRWFLSFLFQDFNQWATAGVLIDDNNYLDTIDKNWHDWDYRTSLIQFCEIKGLLDKCQGTVIYYEDLTYVSKLSKKLSLLVDYESYFPNINEIKQEFENYNLLEKD